MGSVYCSQVYLPLMANNCLGLHFTPDKCKHTCFQKSVSFLLQPPPTYEESVRQSMELPYNIFPSNLDISPPPSIHNNTGPDAPHPVSPDTNGPVPPVWFWSSAPAARWKGKTSYLALYRWMDSPKEYEGQRLIVIGSSTQSDWDWVYVERQTADSGATKEEPAHPLAVHIWMLKTLCDGWHRRTDEIQKRITGCDRLPRWLVHLEDDRITT